MPGLTPMPRMAVAVRSDWVQNSNDSFFYTHPAQTWGEISPLVGDKVVRRPRTRAGLIEIPEMLARGKLTLKAIQDQLFENRNTMVQMVLPDLLQACANAPSPEAKDGCAALAGWNRSNKVDARGAHLFSEFRRAAQAVPGVYRLPFDSKQPALTPAGLTMEDTAQSPRPC